jgi:hypothetical protein
MSISLGPSDEASLDEVVANIMESNSCSEQQAIEAIVNYFGGEVIVLEDEGEGECEECGFSMSSCICIQFADPGGRSALRAASPTNPRNKPCPNCRRSNVLTPADVALGYQCDYCADEAERGGP